MSSFACDSTPHLALRFLESRSLRLNPSSQGKQRKVRLKGGTGHSTNPPICHPRMCPSMSPRVLGTANPRV